MNQRDKIVLWRKRSLLKETSDKREAEYSKTYPKVSYSHVSGFGSKACDSHTTERFSSGMNLDENGVYNIVANHVHFKNDRKGQKWKETNM